MNQILFLACLVATLAISSAIAVRLARQVALNRGMLDVPNERSSHKAPVPRLGGAAFIPLVFLSLAVTWTNSSGPLALRVAVLGGAVGLFVISLLDDFYSLSVKLRFAVQFACAALVVGIAFAGRFSGSTLLIVPLIIVGIVATLNVYNFMDGIDGIAGIQAVVGGLAWTAIATAFGAQSGALFSAGLAGGAIGFLTLNWPPARIFMGDAGSTVIGFSFSTLPFLVSAEVGDRVPLGRLIICGLLVIWPFLADGGFTILRRLIFRENIFKPHRSHLYQRLVIAGKAHQTVALFYGALALIGSVLGWLVMCGDSWAIPLSAGVISLLFGCLWRWTVVCERRMAPRSATDHNSG